MNVPSDTKANAAMLLRSCRVTVRDMEGVAHTVEVTAESLYEAVAQGLAALRGREWVAGLTNGTVKVSVADVRVSMKSKWLSSRGGSTVQAVRRVR